MSSVLVSSAAFASIARLASWILAVSSLLAINAARTALRRLTSASKDWIRLTCGAALRAAFCDFKVSTRTQRSAMRSYLVFARDSLLVSAQNFFTSLAILSELLFSSFSWAAFFAALALRDDLVLRLRCTGLFAVA